MIRIFTFLAAILMLTLSASATKHFSFLGIPLDGDYKAFCSELQKIGFTPDSDNSENTPVSMFYEGVFLGNDARVEVNWTPKTNIVYQVNVGYPVDPGNASSELDAICKLIESKYQIDKVESAEGIECYFVDEYTGGITVAYAEGILVICYMDLENLMLEENESVDDI